MTTLISRSGNILPSVLSDLFETDNFFGTDLLGKEIARTMPSVNITENGKEFRIELAAPGMSKNDFKVNVEDNVLTISAEKEEEKNDKNERYTRREFSYRSFTRSFRLPAEVRSENIEGKYEDGILKLSIPKKEESKKSPAKQIKVS